MNTNQKGASAQGDIVGRDKKIETHVHVSAPHKLSKLEQLKIRLQREIADGLRSAEIIDELKNFKTKTPDDGVTGLEAKLEVSGRAGQKMIALEMKEQFAKLLDKWSLYASAQEIFVHLLAMAEYKFTHQIFPLIQKMDAADVDNLIDAKIISPAIDDVGSDVFSLNHQTAMGMIYWLAEQCRVRWHA